MEDIFTISPLFNNFELDQLFINNINDWLLEEKINAKLRFFPYVDYNDPLQTALAYYKQPIKTVVTEGYFGFSSESRYGYADSNKILIIDVGSILGSKIVPQIAKAPLMASTHEIGRVLKKKVRPETKRIIFTNVTNIAPDLGLGFLEELGIEFYDKNNKKIKVSSGKIGQINSFSYEKIPNKWLGYEYLILNNHDDSTSLIGEKSISYENQELTGASPEIAKLLERETLKAVNTFEKILRKRIMYQPESSVGNGFAFGCLSFFRNVVVQDQLQAFIDLTNVGESIQKTDYFILPDYYFSFRELLSKQNKVSFILSSEGTKKDNDHEIEIPIVPICIENKEWLQRQIQFMIKMFYLKK
ncbi:MULTISPECIES: glycerate kinase [Vagococcus]|uniref:Glycerate kinase n=1 Tax=Vagococcus fluvialis bH819 TaxID=1255619 RepID=A0A1X6WS14_9ENTE|nr:MULTISPECIES: glycerate kinase [Vagococcus]SLM86436.1 Glycerate kinase [Vagococcus fluvialis bH819]HCM90644.1 hypothetical protein [Vagococcus sp.]